MNLDVTTPAATTFASLPSSIFANTGIQFSGHDSAKGLSGLPFSTSFHNDNPTEYSMISNKSIVYHFSTKSDDPQRYGPGALIFMFRNARKLGFECPERSRRVMDLFEINEFFQKVSQNNDRRNAFLGTAEDILHEISFAGVLKTAMTASYRERSLGTAVLNCGVGERASAVNVWGREVREGIGLYLLLIKETGPKSKHKSAWKLVPYVGQKPSISHLMFRENDTITFGGTILIGTAISAPTPCAEGNERLIDDPVRSKRLAMYAGGVDVCIGV